MQDWFRKYPLGARVRKLRRDIAFRMPPLDTGERLGKPGVSELREFLESLHERGVVEMTLSKDADRTGAQPIVRPPPTPRGAIGCTTTDCGPPRGGLVLRTTTGAGAPTDAMICDACLG